MRLIYLSGFLFCVSYVKCCEVSKLSGNILGCVHDDKEVDIESVQNGTLAAGSICIVEILQRVRHVQCEEKRWIIIHQETIDHNKHIRRKRGWWRRAARVAGNIFKGVFKGVVCVASLFTACAFGDRRPSDRTPPGIICDPPIIFETAEPLSYVAKVTWQEPEASDETDGPITPRRRSGYPPGHYFPDGVTTVTYEAKDKSGNRASCDIIVNVTVVRCDPPTHINNGYFQCYPVTEHLNGGTCKFGCYEGFDLVGGPDHVYCKGNGQWSDYQPNCKPWKCPALPLLEGAGEPTCSNGAYFRSICSYICCSGFAMPPKVSKAMVCDKTKSWRRFGTPKCVDVEPPTFKPGTCPSIVIAGTDTGLNSTNVSWKPPEVMDNSNNASRDSRTIYSPGDRLTAGIYSVWYGARDAAGNIALNNCSFKIIVREIRCSKLYPTPYLHIDCPHGYRSGARCNISCDPGKVLVGSDYVGCNRHPTQLYGVWNWKGKEQSTCINSRACVGLQPPKNGAVVCDNWEGGHFCQVQCRNGTQMSSVSLNRLYVCRDGEWSTAPPKIKTCRVMGGNRWHQHLEVEVNYYFNGDCSDPEARQQIAYNFIELIKDSLYQEEVCPNSIECNKGNVQISCGESDRKKRNADYNSILVITAKLPVTLHNNESLYTAEDRYIKLLDGVRDILTENVTAIFGNTTVFHKEFVTKGLQIECPTGSVKSEQSWNCIDCPEGTFYTSGPDSPKCEVCRKGTFQDKAAHLSCVRCPLGKTTHSVGATSVHDCEEACRPGLFSSDGLLPCSPCEQGHYQASYGQTFCRQCRGAKSTVTYGATSASDCEEFDIDLIDGLQTNIHMTLQNNVTIREFTLAFWYQNTATNNLSLDKFPTLKLNDNKNESLWEWEGLRNAKEGENIRNTVNFGLPDTRWHYITLYNSGKCTVSVSVDGMVLPVEDTIIGGCTDIDFNTVSINADNETSGSISQLNIWNGKHQTEYNHRCFSSDIGDVFSWKTMEEAELTGAYMDIPSQCDDFDNCVSSPCLHGSCTDVLHGFTCSCDKGYLGTQCEVNIDDCEANICMNNATCIDGVANYYCSCTSDFTGQYCEIEMVEGDWSEWGNWSECSTTCGDGERRRKRLCNNPAPDNGGEDCHGDAFDFINCNNTDCPVCPEIQPPGNGSIECVNDTDSFNCTMSCDDGFDFDIEPLPLYYCGPQTFQEWNFQNDENPERRIPRCVEIKVPREISVKYSAHYEELYCANQDLEDFATEQIDLTVNAVLSNVACLVKNTCFLNYLRITDCDSKGRRRRSATQTVGFSLQIKTNPTEENKHETLQDLEDAFTNIQTAADSGDFTVQVLDDDYELKNNSTEIQGGVDCGPGQTKVKFYCVPCGKGSYLHIDICKPCPVGTYQSLEAQSSCEKCPKGKSTTGIRSTTVDDCTVSVVVPLKEGLKVTGIIVGCMCTLLVIVVSLFIYRRYRSKQAKLVEPTDINMVSPPGPHSSQKNGKLGPKNVHFEVVTLSQQENFPEISQPNFENSSNETKQGYHTCRSSTFISEDGKVIHSKPWR